MKLSKYDTETIMRSKLFHGTAESVMTRMAAGTDCELVFYKKGECIYSPSNFKRSLGVIVEGSVRILKENADGHKIILNTLNTGDIFGAAALFGDKKEYISEIYAIDSCRVVFFSERLVLRGIERDSHLAENYIRYLSDRIVFLNRKLVSLTSGSAHQRLANFFYDNLSEEYYSSLPLSMTELSRGLNISRASLYRALDLLTASGAVSKRGKEYKIEDITILETI